MYYFSLGFFFFFFPQQLLSLPARGAAKQGPWELMVATPEVLLFPFFLPLFACTSVVHA